MKSDIVYLCHIDDAIKTIKEYLGDMDFAAFLKNKLIQDGAIRQIEIIGEAARHLSQEFKNKYPKIPWRDMTDMRNFLIHEYFGVNSEAVWNTCKNELKELEKIIASYRE